MLVLTRKVGESVVITTPDRTTPSGEYVPGESVTVTVSSLQPNGKVRIGFAADPDVEIWREEIQAERDAGEVVRP